MGLSYLRIQVGVEREDLNCNDGVQIAVAPDCRLDHAAIIGPDSPFLLRNRECVTMRISPRQITQAQLPNWSAPALRQFRFWYRRFGGSRRAVAQHRARRLPQDVVGVGAESSERVLRLSAAKDNQVCTFLFGEFGQEVCDRPSTDTHSKVSAGFRLAPRDLLRGGTLCAIRTAAPNS